MNDADSILGVVLAGGLSRRMDGPEKSLLEFSGQPLVAHICARLAPQVARLVVNANGDPARFAGLGLPVVPDTIPGHAGPLAGILAGMRWAQANTPQLQFIATAATDTPFFPSNYVAKLAEAGGMAAGTIALATSGGNRHPVFGLWPVALADDLENFLKSGEHGKVMLFVQRHHLVEVPFEVAAPGVGDPFFNINTPEDMERAREFEKGLETWIEEGVSRDA